MRQKPPRRMIAAGKRGCALRSRIRQLPVYLMSYFFNKLFCQKKPIVSKRSRQEFLFVYFEPRTHSPFDPTPELPCHYWPADYLHWWTLARPNKKNTHRSQILEKYWWKIVGTLFCFTRRLDYRFSGDFFAAEILAQFLFLFHQIARGYPQDKPKFAPRTHKKTRLIAIDRKKQQKKFFFSSLSSFSLSGGVRVSFLYWRRIHPGKIMSLGVDLQTLETVSQTARHQKRYSE